MDNLNDEGAAPELAPCPFCGGTDAFVERLDYSAAYVQCDSAIDEHSACCARGPVGVQDDDCEEIPGAAAAIRAWNEQAARRAPVAAPAADGLPALPTLPRYLLEQIGEYGMARTDSIGQLEVMHRWEVLISYIKRYATAYALDAIAANRLARQPVLDEQAAVLLAKQKKIQAMRTVGVRMANTMFNLAQRPGECIDAKLAASMKDMQEEWDASLRTPTSAASKNYKITKKEPQKEYAK